MDKVMLNWNQMPPASELTIQQLASACDFVLPTSYLNFLRQSNGGEGELSIAPGWLQLWPAEEVISANEEYHVPEFISGYFAFGGSGGGELIVFRVVEDQAQEIYMIPCISMGAKEALLMAESFDEFEKEIGHPWPAA
jgi:hypothetical protein